MRHWYRRDALAWLLWPLSLLYCTVMRARRHAYRQAWFKSERLGVPVIVVGNISVGGTGKTPLVIWLIDYLRAQGWRPGIISRGYRGTATHWPQAVSGDSDPLRVGDEPVLLARRCQCPVSVAPSRVAAAQALLAAHPDCDILVADDGLQHYALQRDIEIAVIDAERGHGNGWCLPAGPLREPISRLAQVDIRVWNGAPQAKDVGMRLQGDVAVSLRSPGQQRRLGEFAGRPVHAVCGIGHPQRFFAHLRAHGLEVIEHAYADHHVFAAGELSFKDDLPVLMTEKDAVKCQACATERHWVVAVSAIPDSSLSERLSALLTRRLHG